MLAYLVTAGAGEELLVGRDGEAEGALDHGPDGGWFHGTRGRVSVSVISHRNVSAPACLSLITGAQLSRVRVISLSPPCHRVAHY